MRMVPIEPTFRKMARLVRDLSKKSGKEIDFVMEGAETELDKSMVEKLGDPLVHMVRNSVDHGIEASPEDRVKAGKKPAGRVVLRAFHKSGSINIEIEDDGRGLDREAIVAKGIEKGLITSGSGMSDQEVFGMIFLPGFSTAKQITEVSGRGVGMDVVNKNIESLRGNVIIKSEKGKGAVFTIVLPLTMAIIDGMSVGVGSEVYIIPTLSIIESLRPSPEMVSTVVGRGEVIKFRNRLLPAFRLSRLFNVEGAVTEVTEALAVIVEDSGKQVAVIVDELIGQQQTVIKTLGVAMGRVPGISGASILADGRPGLILDISGLVKVAMSGDEEKI
jgi:two-component system, chemotaxis family, sensor kinase CheA